MDQFFGHSLFDITDGVDVNENTVYGNIDSPGSVLNEMACDLVAPPSTPAVAEFFSAGTGNEEDADAIEIGKVRMDLEESAKRFENELGYFMEGEPEPTSEILTGFDPSMSSASVVDPLVNQIQLMQNYTVAPVMTQYIDGPNLLMGQGTEMMITSVSNAGTIPARGRRKSGQGRRCSTDETPLFETDMKPTLAMLPTLGNSRGKKRPHTIVAPPSPVIACKKIKKYEMEDSDNPSVRNARAAKANREKKKQEIIDLRAKNVELEAEKAIDRQKISELEETVRKLTNINRSLTYQVKSTNGIVQCQNDIQEYLSRIVPAMGHPVPNIILAPGFVAPEPGTRSITTQFNLDTNFITVSCPVIPATVTNWNAGTAMPPPQ